MLKAGFFRWALAPVLVLFLQTPVPAPAAGAGTEIGTVTNLPIPRYVSLRSSKINVRRGPGLDYRKDWVFRRAGWPVKIIDEYGDWRRIVDKDDAGGWVFHAMLTGRRTVLVTGESVFFRKTPRATSKAVAEAEQGVVARLHGCEQDWCEVEKDGYRGWVQKADLWGVDEKDAAGAD